MVHKFLSRLKSKTTSQLELPLKRQREPDRNLHRGGRSFYFFDFDDNVAFLSTPTFLFHKQNRSEIRISSQQVAQLGDTVGKSGIYADYVFDHDPEFGSFRHFRDKDFSILQSLMGKEQIFLKDLAATLDLPDISWKGPSWNCFYHAVFNSRPMALITARGHHPKTIKDGVRLWVRQGLLPQEPNYLAVYPVSHPEIKKSLGLDKSDSIPHLKQKALRASVESALKIYGKNPHHRFGMSDDDPRNIEWIAAEMKVLKKDYPQMSFFIISTHGEQMLKLEILSDHVETQILESEAQLTLFDE
jgi:hypothetical protein